MRRATLSCLTLGALLGACGPTFDLDSIARHEDLRHSDSVELRQALVGSNPEVRARAARAMGRIQSPSYASDLTQAARSDADLAARLAAIFALGQLGLAEGAQVPAPAVEALEACLDDPDPDVVAGAVEALGKLAPPELPRTVLPLLRHSSPRVRTEAAHALFRHRFVPVWRRQTEDPPPLPAEATQALAQALSDESPDVRWAAAHAFSRYGGPGALTALTAALHDESEWTRLFAVRAVGRSANPEAASSLGPALADDSPRVRAEAVQALATLGTLAGVDWLEELARDASFHVRAAVAQGLGASRGEAGLALLRRLERDASTTVQAAAVQALARRLGPGYEGNLASYLDAAGTTVWPLRVAAARGLAGLEAGASPRLEGLLDGALADKDTRVQAAAVESLGALGRGPGWDERLARALAHDDLAVRGTAVTVLAASESSHKLEWLESAYDTSPGQEWIEVRESVVDTLTQMARETEGEDSSVDALLLRIAAHDAAPSVRSRARLSLSRQGRSVEATEPLPGEPSPFLGQTFATDPRVILDTSKGEIEIRGLARQAPIHVANFLTLVRQGFYDGTVWHRVVPNFVIQGGDPRGDGWGGPGYTLRDEINPVPYGRGAVGMPKAGKDTGGCQIFITHVPTPHLNGNYTVFGLVVSGLAVVDEIELGDKILRAYVVE